MKYYAVIVAGGSGSRMKSDLPKQFLPVLGKPVVMHTMEAFYRSELQPEIILVLNNHYHSFWRELCAEYAFDLPHILVAGGQERFDSVKNALSHVTEPAVVAVHDAVRPIVSNELISRCFREAEKNGSAIPVTESRDSLRKKQDNDTCAIPREEILIVQTPQTFRATVLKKAYQQPFSTLFTDDASVVESSGEKIHVTTGDPSNLKITYQQDLAVAELYMKQKRSGVHTGS